MLHLIHDSKAWNILFFLHTALVINWYLLTCIHIRIGTYKDETSLSWLLFNLFWVRSLLHKCRLLFSRNDHIRISRACRLWIIACVAASFVLWCYIRTCICSEMIKWSPVYMHTYRSGQTKVLIAFSRDQLLLRLILQLSFWMCECRSAKNPKRFYCHRLVHRC
jgi:hypothetical protein